MAVMSADMSANGILDMDGFGNATGPARTESVKALFALGFAAGVGALIAVSSLHGQGSLVAGLRSDRLAQIDPNPTRISVSVVRSDLGVPPELATAPARRSARLSPPSAPVVVPEDENAVTVAALEARFAALDYDLSAVRQQGEPVPRTLTEEVPKDLADINEVDRRKKLFFRMVLPLVLVANERLTADRVRIIDLRDRHEAGEDLSAKDQAWLQTEFDRYKVDQGDFSRLLRRVDVVPPSLAMAQAAIESGWGTSRFAQEGNALFGQWVWGDNADGIVPEDREEGRTHKIRAFDTPLMAVQAYIKNLNTHRAYREFRDMRAQMRQDGSMMNGMTLAQGLESYSEKGDEYVGLVRSIITANRLRPLDHAKLRDRRA